jgi:Xaa-Pro aminopeptidase
MQTKATLDERDQRYRRLRAAMAAAGLDALLVAGKGHWWTGRGYIRYLTDFHLWGHDGLLLVPLAGEPSLTLTSPAVAAKIAARGWVSDADGDVFLAPRVAAAIRDRGLARARIGVAGMRSIIGAGVLAELREAVPGAELVDADELIDRVRMIRSALEIQQIRELWDLSKSCMERFVEIVAPGKTGLALAAECSRIALEGGARDILVFMGEEPGRVTIPDDTPVRCDGILMYHMEICGPSGHWSELTVTCAYRPPSELEQRLMESELRAYAAIRAAARPGATLPQLAALFEQTLVADGWELGAPTRHFDFHSQGQDTIERPWFAAEQPWGGSQSWPLEAGMTFSYHPRRAVLPAVGWGTGINEDILITPDGAERLSGDWDLRWRRM